LCLRKSMVWFKLCHNWTFKWVHLWLGYTKGMSCRKITLKLPLWIIIMLQNNFLARFFFQYIVIYFLIKMLMIFCNLNHQNIFLNVLKDGSNTLFHYAILSKSTQCWGLAIFVQIAPNLSTNEIKYVLYNGTNF